MEDNLTGKAEVAPGPTVSVTPRPKQSARAALRKALPYFLLAMCSILYLYPFLRVVRQRTDEGTMLYGAVRVVQGQVPFRDFFEAYVGPGTFYWLALFFRVFGTTWLASRISVMVTSVTSIVVMYHLTRRLRTGFDLAPAVLMVATSAGLLWPVISHHSDSNLFALLAFSALLWWVDKPQPIRLLAAGVLAGVTTCFLQPKGGLLILSFYLILWFLSGKSQEFWRAAAWLSAGYVTIGALVVSWFWAAGGLRDLFDTAVMWPLTRYTGLNSIPYGTGLLAFYWERWTAPLIAQFNALIGYSAGSFLLVPHLVIAGLPLLLILLAVVLRGRAFTRLTLPYWIAGSALWVAEIHRKDIMHLVFGSPLLVILFFYLFHKLRKRWSTNALQLITVSAAALVMFNGLVILSAQTKVATRRGVVREYGPDAVFDFLSSNTSPGEEVFAYPYGPMYYFLADLKNPTRFSFLLYDQNLDSQFREAVQTLEARKVRYVLWDKSLEDESGNWAFPPGWSFRRTGQIMEPYLMEHYEIVKDVNGVRILARKQDEASQSALEKAQLVKQGK
jgi:hypothetical protein